MPSVNDRPGGDLRPPAHDFRGVPANNARCLAHPSTKQGFAREDPVLENWLRPAFRYSLVAVIFLSTIVFTSGCTSGTGPKKITGIATGSAGGGTGNTGSSIGTSGKGTGSGTTVVFIG